MYIKNSQGKQRCSYSMHESHLRKANVVKNKYNPWCRQTRFCTYCVILSKVLLSFGASVSSYGKELILHLVQYSLLAKVTLTPLFSATLSFSVCKYFEVVLWSILFDSQLFIILGEDYVMLQGLEPRR